MCERTYRKAGFRTNSGWEYTGSADLAKKKQSHRLVSEMLALPLSAFTLLLRNKNVPGHPNLTSSTENILSYPNESLTDGLFHMGKDEHHFLKSILK